MNFESLAPERLPHELQAFLAGFPVSLMHAGVMLVMLFLGGVLYSLISPYKEISQIREGNAAAAVAFGGMIVGLAIPLAAALAASNSMREIAIWGAATVVVQLLVFRIVDLVLMGLPGRVQEGEISAAVLLVAAKLAAALVLAASVSG